MLVFKFLIEEMQSRDQFVHQSFYNIDNIVFVLLVKSSSNFFKDDFFVFLINSE